MKVVPLLVLSLLCACARPHDPAASPVPVSTAGLPHAPLPVRLESPDRKAFAHAKSVKLCGDDVAIVADRTGDTVFVGCAGGRLFELDSEMRELRSTDVHLHVNAIMPAGADAVAISGASGGATLLNVVTIRKMQSLAAVMPDASDVTYLGTYDGRAYIDDWCCNGRADTYEPATIYSVSLKDGTASKETDLRPGPQEHPANLAPIGQGESNYLIGKYFYVHVEQVTYRYDVTNLNKPPLRMRSSLPWGPGTSP